MMEDFLRDFPKTKSNFKNVFCTSDHHFGHKNILSFEPIRTEIMEAEFWRGTHDEFMVDNWNKQVGNDDLVIYLGDFAFNHLAKYAKKLNGTILLILGNHDRKPQAYAKIPNIYVVDGFWEFTKGTLARKYHVDLDDALFSALLIEDVLFSHYPIYSEDPYDTRRNNFITRRIEQMRAITSRLGRVIYNTHGHSHSQTGIHNLSHNVCIDNMKFKMIRISV